jgi:hypothetical protein
MTNLTVEIIIIIAIIMVMLFDLYSQYIRGCTSSKNSSQLIAKANWVQYQARILTMMAIMMITFAFEKKIINFDILKLLGFSFLCSSIVGLLYVINNNIFKAINLILRVPTYFTFKTLYSEVYYYKLIFCLNKVYLYSLFFNLLIGFAMAVPFIVATSNPDMRMTAAYVGQAFNFIASIVNFNLIEPYYYKALDEKKESEITSQLIISKITSNIIIFIVLTLL